MIYYDDIGVAFLAFLGLLGELYASLLLFFLGDASVFLFSSVALLGLLLARLGVACFSATLSSFVALDALALDFLVNFSFYLASKVSVITFSLCLFYRDA